MVNYPQVKTQIEAYLDDVLGLTSDYNKTSSPNTEGLDAMGESRVWTRVTATAPTESGEIADINTLQYDATYLVIAMTYDEEATLQATATAQELAIQNAIALAPNLIFKEQVAHPFYEGKYYTLSTEYTVQNLILNIKES